MPMTGRSPSLQQTSLLVARGFRHDAFAPCPLLSVKCMFNGNALYRPDRAYFSLDDRGYLILNDRQPYEIHINSPTEIESFIVFFSHGWAEEVHRSLSALTEQLLDEPMPNPGRPVHFFERFTPHDKWVSPLLKKLRRAHKNGSLADFWLEQNLRQLLASMFHAQSEGVRETDALSAQRPATREELWRSLNRARDFIHARFYAA